MEIHGFAHTSSWAVICHTESVLQLALESSAKMMGQYPFPFRVELTFSVENGRLTIRQRYENRGCETMPYAFGFHPYFAVENVACAEVTVNAEAEMDMQTGKPTALRKNPVRLSFPQGAQETGAFFLNSRQGVTVKSGNNRIRMHFDDNFPRLVLWAVKGKGFLCAEPINSSPNGLATGDCLYLAPGEIREAEISFETL